ncbi:MAG: hypothetical protein QOH42_118, partial [Blastocatellia bacterium]|nr:hypothetical protein [Blastocatellia bacterium]
MKRHRLLVVILIAQLGSGAFAQQPSPTPSNP